MTPTGYSSAAPSTGAGVAALHSACAQDALEQAALQSWVPMECYQLSRGDHSARMDILALANERIVREQQNVSVQKLGVMPTGLCTLSLSRSQHCRFSEVLDTSSELVFYLPEQAEFDVHVPAGVETVYISFSQDAFLEAARILDPEGFDKAPDHLMAWPASQRGVLWALVDYWLQLAHKEHKSQLNATLFNSAFLDAVLPLVLPPPLDTAIELSAISRHRALRIGRAAREYVTASLQQDMVPSLIDICRTLDVSQRTLQYAFMDYAGMTPTAYLRHIRLNRVHHELRMADARSINVTQTAMRFGFSHLGRFARDYRKLFGAPPSHTLAGTLRKK